MKKVLVVDDEELFQIMISEILSPEGFEVIVAGDGEAAISLAQKEKPDLILLDMGMPVMPGWVTARELKLSGTVTANIPIIAVTAHTTSDDEEAARKAGCDDFIAKPIDADNLIKIIDRVLD